jgi:hypothetical protein
MRLLCTETLTFDEFMGDKFPPYAILSHTWDEQEITYHDMLNLTPAIKMKAGYKKTIGFATKSKELGYQHCWIDTCCIDKSSSAELTEAINSMFSWYGRSSVCIVYIEDYQEPIFGCERLGLSRWFTRGWTLQELIAPRQDIVFFKRDWSSIAVDNHLLSEITGIPTEVLKSGRTQHMSIAQKMCWAANRTTTRIEDIAYCLMGLFDVNMPLLYGEGNKAFERLQEEIIKRSTDQTIFLRAEQGDVKIYWRG